MEKETLENFEKAKEIYKKIENFAKPLIKPGVKILDIAEQIENKIKELGGKPAFPVNISIDDIAAHYTPDVNENTILKEKNLVKIDIGVHVNGWIYDGAFSVFVGEKTHPLIEAAKKAVEAGTREAKAGVKICDVSEVIENVVKEFGFNVIRNLSGHRLDRFNLHAEPSIPNNKNKIDIELEKNWIIAIEVFTTAGAGWVKDSRPILIFQYLQDKATRMHEARKILEMSKKDFETLPFTKRWIKNISLLKMDLALNQLLELEAIQAHPILKEESGAIVAQWEESIVVK
ncbi:MAG: type II methionyl aminopeptidase [Candidatus Aenigmatarchaeota archaeon]